MTTKGKKTVGVIVPFLNEEENLPIMYDRLVKMIEGEPEDLQIIFVDDGSKDGSPQWVSDKSKEDPRVNLIRLSRNFGHQIAITAGLDYCNTDAVVIIDADLQDPPEVISDLLKKWREGNDVVYAVRKSREGESFMKKFLAASFYRVFHKMAQIQVPMDTGDFRLVDRKVVDAMREVRELHRFMRGLTTWVGFQQCAVHYERAPRNAGDVKYTIFKSARLAVDALTSFSSAPLKWMTGAGIFVAVLGFLVAAYTAINKIMRPDVLVEGWTTVVVLVLILGGLQLLCLGLLGMYVGRTYEEAKRRPLYYVKEVAGELHAPSK